MRLIKRLTRSLNKSLLVTMIAIAVVSLGTFTFLTVRSEYQKFLSDTDNIRTSFLNTRKIQLQADMQKAFDFIECVRLSHQRHLKADIKERTQNACNVADHIFQNHQGEDSQSVAGRILEALKFIRFNNGAGYFFVIRMDGVSLLSGDHPELEGTDLTRIPDTQGRPIIKDMIDMVKVQQEGFYQYTWSKPDNNGNHHEKTAYVKYFQPMDWLIGCGIYASDTQTALKKEILEQLQHSAFNKDNYFFITTFDGQLLMNAAEPLLVGKNIWDMTDPAGLKIVQEPKKAVQNAKSGFITYSWNRPGYDKPVLNLSFVKAVPDWQWILGTGTYLNELEENIIQEKTALKHQLKTHLINITLIFLLILLPACAFVFLLSRRLEKSFKTFLHFFDNAATRSIEIDMQDIHFTEFQTLARAANQMVALRAGIEMEKQKEIKNREKSKKEMERLRTAVQQVAEAIVITDTSGAIEFVNQGFEKITGFAAHEVIGDNPRILKSGQHDTAFYKQMWTTILSGRIWKDQLVNRKKDGSFYTEKTTISPVRDSEGNITNFVAVKHDISEDLRKSDMLAQAQKMEAIGTLASGIAHDFNNILFPLMGFSEMLHEDLPEDSPLQDNIKEVLTAAKRAKELVNQILTFSRQGKNEPQPLKIQIVIKEALKLLRASIPKTIEFKIDISPDCGMVLADPIQIHQIIINLATNAYQAMKKSGGRLTVTLREKAMPDPDTGGPKEGLLPGSYALISISDTGTGIAEEFLDKVFDPYFTTKSKDEGTGLGLAVVKGIVESCRGAIWADSVPGEGSQFNICLPVLHTPPDTVDQELPDEVTGGSERILLVDDEASILRMQQQTLERLGYTVEARQDSVDALKQFMAQPEGYDLVISDLSMPHMTGIELAQKILSIRPELPVIICSGFSEKVDAAGAISAGIRDFLMKPVIKRDMARAIRNALGSREDDD